MSNVDNNHKLNTMLGESECLNVEGRGEIKLLTQAGVVEDLLKAVQRVLNEPTPTRLQSMEAALRAFEHFTAPVVYGVEDVAGVDSTLSLDEQLEALEDYAHNYQIKDADLYAIKHSIDVIRSNTN